MPELKAKLKSRTSVKITGLELSMSNPYWANKQQIDLMKDHVEFMIQEGKDTPTKRFEITDVQKKKLGHFIELLEDKYLSKL